MSFMYRSWNCHKHSLGLLQPSDSGMRHEGREREINKEEKRERLSPLPHPLVVVVVVVVFFSVSAHISLPCPHDLDTRNRLSLVLNILI